MNVALHQRLHRLLRCWQLLCRRADACFSCCACSCTLRGGLAGVNAADAWQHVDCCNGLTLLAVASLAAPVCSCPASAATCVAPLRHCFCGLQVLGMLRALCPGPFGASCAGGQLPGKALFSSRRGERFGDAPKESPASCPVPACCGEGAGEGVAERRLLFASSRKTADTGLAASCLVTAAPACCGAAAGDRAAESLPSSRGVGHWGVKAGPWGAASWPAGLGRAAVVTR